MLIMSQNKTNCEIFNIEGKQRKERFKLIKIH